MKRNIKMLLMLISVFVLSFTMLAACGKKGDDKSDGSETDPVVENNGNVDTDPVDNGPDVDDPVDEEPAMDLGGMEIIIGDWWSPEVPDEPSNAYQEARLEYREMIQDKYNFKVKEVAITDWNGMQELFTTSTVAEDPAAHVFLLHPGWIVAPIANGLVYDLATLDNLDFSESKWINNVREATTVGNSIYGMNAGNPEPRLGVFWNKRLFQEAGLDPDHLYNLQASGEWTWEALEEVCEVLTRDINSDGITDQYAMANFNSNIFRGALMSNDARYIGKTDDGKFYSGLNDPNFLEAIQWVISLIDKGYEMPAPEDAEWNWFGPAFVDGKVAMQAGEEYMSSQELASMEDDFGFVLFPKGPKSGNKYNVYFNDNTAVIPACFDKETAEKIAFAYNLWTDPVPGYEDSDAWKDWYYTKFRDDRAVDETLAMMYDVAVENNDFSPYVEGLDMGPLFIWDVFAKAKTPAEAVEEITGTVQSLVDEANK